MRQIKGFDYATRKVVMLTHAQWQARMRGKRRRAESDAEGAVTYIYAADGKLEAEVYANVPAPHGEAVS